MKKWVTALIAFAVGAVYCALLFLPYPRRVDVPSERYLCYFEDGSEEELAYADACRYLSGVSEEGEILLLRDGVLGMVPANSAMREAVRILEHADTAELIYHVFDVGRLGRAALLYAFGDRLYCDGNEYYAYTGVRVVRTSIRRAEELRLLGNLPDDALRLTGATSLHVYGRAELNPAALMGTSVAIAADPPYAVQGGALYLETVGGRRLVAAEPNTTQLHIENYVFADKGALLPCESLCSLELPFLSSDAYGGGAHGGELAYLFCLGGDYYVPETLTKLRVHGGVITGTAFYACHALEEIDLCGVDAANIDRSAFSGLDLSLLHTPRADVMLTGSYDFDTASCGCTVYRKIQEVTP